MRNLRARRPRLGDAAPTAHGQTPSPSRRMRRCGGRFNCRRRRRRRTTSTPLTMACALVHWPPILPKPTVLQRCWSCSSGSFLLLRSRPAGRRRIHRCQDDGKREILLPGSVSADEIPEERLSEAQRGAHLYEHRVELICFLVGSGADERTGQRLACPRKFSCVFATAVEDTRSDSKIPNPELQSTDARSSRSSFGSWTTAAAYKRPLCQS